MPTLISRRARPGRTSSAGSWRTIAPGKKPGRNAWHITKTGSRPARRKLTNRTGRSTPLPGRWITCTALWTTLTTCLSRNPGGCLSSGSWNTGTAALAVRICRESRLTDLSPPDTSPPGEQEPPLLLFPCALTAVIMGQGTSPLSPAGRDPPPGGTPGQP